MNEKIKEILSSLSFVESQKLKQDKKREEFIFVGEIKGRSVLFKISNKKNFHRVSMFEKEKAVDKIFEKHNKDLSNPLIVKTDIFGSGEERGYIWIARKYYPGKSLSYFQSDKPFFGYDVIRRNFLLKKNQIINKIIENIETINLLETDLRRLSVEKNFFNRRFSENPDFSVLEKTHNLNTDKQQAFFQKNKSEYFDKSNIKASTNDLHPGNIILKSDNQLVFSDFEHFTFDNYTVDIATLWLFLWRYKNWQKYFIEKTINNDADRMMFRMSMIRLYQYFHKLPLVGEKNLQKGKKNAGFSKWMKYFVAAGDSFDAIMKVK